MILDLFRRRPRAAALSAPPADKDLADVMAVATRTFPDAPNLALPLVAALLRDARRAHRAGKLSELEILRFHLEPKLWALGVDPATADRMIREV